MYFSSESKINYAKRLKHPVFKSVAEICREQGISAYVIGGYVRDMILERPSKDIDIVVLGSGIELAQEVAKRLKNTSRITIFKNFGTAMFKYGEDEIEFVGARKESYRKDSRKPVVEDGSLKDDQERRDFTINALAISLCEQDFGQLTDPFNGLKDLQDNIVRTPLDPGITFSDDPLRMLRAVRFATQLNFSVHKDTFSAIREKRDRMKIVSGERISGELEKILMSPKPSTGFKLLESTGLLEIILPELDAMKGVEVKEGNAHKDNFLHTLKVLDKISRKTQNPWLRWAALLHDIGKPVTKKYINGNWTFHGHDFIGSKMIRDIFKSLKLPLNDKMKYVQKLVGLHLRPIVLSQEEVTDSAIRRLLFDAGDDIDDLMTLCEADITSKNDEKVKLYLKNFKLVRKKLKEVEEKDRIRNFQPPVTGGDIMHIFNIKPGRTIGILKAAIKDAILDGAIRNDRQEAINFLLKKGKDLGLKVVNRPDALTSE